MENIKGKDEAVKEYKWTVINKLKEVQTNLTVNRDEGHNVPTWKEQNIQAAIDFIANESFVDREEGWIEIVDGCPMPEYDEDVLVYYEIENKGKDPHRYTNIGCVTNSSEGKSYKHYEWRDKEYNVLTPTYWRKLPSPPINNKS